MFFVYLNVLVAAATSGGTAPALDGNITTSAATTVRTKPRVKEPINDLPLRAGSGADRTYCRRGWTRDVRVGRSPPQSPRHSPARRVVQSGTKSARRQRRRAAV